MYSVAVKRPDPRDGGTAARATGVPGVVPRARRAMGAFDPGTELGPRLRQVREQRGLSARELARRIQCSPSLISQIERGLSAPSVGMLYALATEHADRRGGQPALDLGDQAGRALEPPG